MHTTMLKTHYELYNVKSINYTSILLICNLKKKTLSKNGSK